MFSVFSDRRKEPRRSGDERRQGKDVPQQDNRSNDERRTGDDRRTWPFGLLFKTAESGALIEDWLQQSCQGDCGVELQGIDEDQMKKIFKVMFELESDKLQFIEHFKKK